MDETIMKALKRLSDKGVKGAEARETLMAIGAGRFLALDDYARKVRAAKAGKKVEFEKRQAVKWGRITKARKPAKAHKLAKVRKPAKEALAPDTRTFDEITAEREAQ